MATRRRFPPKFRDGGAVLIPADDPHAEIEQETAPARADEPQPVPSPDEALRAAIEGQRRAEAMQRRRTEETQPRKRQRSSSTSTRSPAFRTSSGQRSRPIQSCYMRRRAASPMTLTRKRLRPGSPTTPRP